jgi:hypothetical protein
MKVGDLVKYKGLNRIGIIIDNVRVPGNRKNKVFRVFWTDETSDTIWDYDLRVINESG